MKSTILFSVMRSVNYIYLRLFSWSVTSFNLGKHIQDIMIQTVMTSILHPILNWNNHVPTRVYINIFELYNDLILMYTWALLVFKFQWNCLKAVQSISTRTVIGISSYVENQITIPSISNNSNSLLHPKPLLKNNEFYCWYGNWFFFLYIYLIISPLKVISLLYN